MYLINLLPKSFPLSASSEVYNKQKMQTLSQNIYIFLKKQKKEMTPKTKLNKKSPERGPWKSNYETKIFNARI